MRSVAALLLVALLGSACAVPQQQPDAAAAAPGLRRLEDMGRAGLKETVKAKMKEEGELAITDENGTVAVFETVEERIEALKEIVLAKQRELRDFILDQGIDEKAEIMAMQDELQKYEREYKSLVIANTPPTPSPYEDGTGECVDGDCQDGEGVYEWADGGRYEGSFVNGSKHGKGMYDAHATSGVYTGTWTQGKPDGWGTFTAKDNQWNYTGPYVTGYMQTDQPPQEDRLGTYTFERCRWSMVEKYREHYCANKDRVVVYKGDSSYKGSLSECAAIVQKDERCGTELYYAGSSTAATSDCVCLRPDDTCKAKPSNRVNHVYAYACEGGVMVGGFTQGAPDGKGLWTGFDGGSFDGYYELGQMKNGTFVWPDKLGKDGAKGTFIGPWRLKVPVWENGTYITSQGEEIPGGNRTADQALQEKLLEEKIAAIEEEPGGEVPTRLYKDAPIDADVRTSSHTTTPHHLSVRNASNPRYTVVLRCALPERSTGLCVVTCHAYRCCISRFCSVLLAGERPLRHLHQ